MYGCAPDLQHNTIFMAMELLKGRSFFDLLKRDVPDLKTMLHFFCEIASALGEAHKHGIFHRDLKPENVFIVKDENGMEHAKVLDFGFARLQGAAKKLTMAGVAFGTPHYMSPEQAMGLDDITAACDIYAMGIMLFQAVSGNLPYDNDSPMEVMRSQVYDPTPECNPRTEYQVPNRLISCIQKCMKKDPKERYADGHILFLELDDILNKLDKDKDIAKPTLHSQAAVSPIKRTNTLPAGKVTVTPMMIVLAIVLFLMLVLAAVLVAWILIK